MENNKLRLQKFRTNDLVQDSGKQIEFGTSWCNDFFMIPSSEKQVTYNLTFKPLTAEQSLIGEKSIELKLSELTNREDRKAYCNGENGYSQLKAFFINDLNLDVINNLNDYFVLYKIDSNNYLLFYVPHLLYDNFVRLFQNSDLDVRVEKKKESVCLKEPLQQIFYGAPGTGKSYEVKKLTGEIDDVGNEYNKPNVFRTTFHPDTDYATFVGCYKPTMQPVQEKYRAVAGKEEDIVYEFVPQAFTDVYIYAYNNTNEQTYLVIEEINRGNCAQIFGDLFQLLDRKADGTSDYTIKADKDLAKYLMDAKDAKGNDILLNKEGITDGKLRLPKNLNILATMNTSDQSLFPIDSAFKRRWDWKYIPINTNVENWTIDVQDVHYSWSSFLNKINTEIGDTTSSEDKKLGFYFCKAKDGVISAERFVSKVLFYIYNDVFKDYGFDKEFFKDNENGNKTIAFQDFFNPNGTINELNVKKILNNLGVEII